VTVSRRLGTDAIGWHYDKIEDTSDEYKILLYLSTAGGTEFEGGHSITGVSAGDVVVFDIKMCHRGLPSQTTSTKYTLGFRAASVKSSLALVTPNDGLVVV
jgi:hypothetical protein